MQRKWGVKSLIKKTEKAILNNSVNLFDLIIEVILKPNATAKLVEDKSQKSISCILKKECFPVYLYLKKFGFFEQYIAPSIANKIIYNTIVSSIDYSGNQIVVNTQSGQHITDKVIVSVPLKILQDSDISFLPNLPQDKINAINNTTIWEGFRAFFEFCEKFYDDNYPFNINPKSDG